jgi:NitT/TauT family transport system ATP-binding protein
VAEKIKLEGLSKKFASAEGTCVSVLRNINLSILDGAFYCLLGPSGCGKTTLLNILAGFELPSAGKAIVNGREVRSPGTERTVIFQDVSNAIFPWLTVLENAEYGPRMAGVPKAQGRKLALEFLKLVRLDRDYKKFPSELSGGMKQRVQMARALANQPEILLMDEPFAALDAITKRVLQRELVRIWRETRKTIFYITHDILEALTLGTHIGVMSHGPNASIRQEFTVSLTEPRKPTNDDFNQLFLQIEKIIEEEVEKLVEEGVEKKE